MNFLKQNSTFLITFLITIIVFDLMFGLHIINPGNTNWIFSAKHDWGQHYLGWEFFRNEPWRFPLGKIEAICYPSGTNVGYMDSIPLLAVFFKIFSFALPNSFQYLGGWLLFCFLMTAYYSVKIFKLYNIKTIHIILATVLITFNATLVYRTMHPALSAHWLILACLYLYLKPATSQNVYKINKQLMLLVIGSAVISPYLPFFISGFAVIIPFKHYFYDKLIPLKKVFIYPAICCFSIVLLWLALGMISFNDSTNLEVKGGYGVLSMNLNTFYNSWEYSPFLPSFPSVTNQQYEGFSYLGVGVMLLLIIAIIYFVAFQKPKEFIKQHKNLLPLLLMGLSLTLFAISHKVSINDKVLFELPFPKILIQLGNVFRASGRAVWIIFYMILLFFTIIFLKSKIPNVLKIIILLLVLALQAYDLKVLYFGRIFSHGAYESPLNETEWDNAVAPFDRIITYPPYNNHLLTTMDYQELCLIVLRNHKAISTGYTARDNTSAYKAYSDSLSLELEKGIIHDKELYVTTPQYLDMFDCVLHNRKAELSYLDGYYLIYSKKAKHNIAAAKDPAILKKIDSVNNVYSSTNIIKSVDKITYNDDRITITIDKFSKNDNSIKIRGRAFLQKNNSINDSVFITLSNNDKTFIVKTKQSAKQNSSYINIEFWTTLFTENLEGEDYNAGLMIKAASGEMNHYNLGKVTELDKVYRSKDLIASPKKTDANLYKDLSSFDKTQYLVQKFEQNENVVNIEGWIYLEMQDAVNSKKHIVLIKKDIAYNLPVETVRRTDIAEYFKLKYNLDDAGFSVTADISNMEDGEYKVGIYVEDKATGKKGLAITDKMVIKE